MNETEEKKEFKELLAESIIPKVEKICLTIYVIGLLLLLGNFEGRMMAFIALNLLSLTYFLSPPLLDRSEFGSIDFIMLKVGLVASAVTIFGSMFALAGKQGASTMLVLGLITNAIATSFCIYFIYSKNVEKLKLQTIRLGIASIIGLLHYTVYL